MAGSLTRDQRIAEAKRTGQCGLILADWSTPCPKRNGPVNPSSDHPGKVGFPGANGFCTCSGCEHFLGLDWNNYVCTHPNARAVAARALAERIRAWEESRAPAGQIQAQPEPPPRPESEPPQAPSPQPEPEKGPTQLSLF